MDCSSNEPQKTFSLSRKRHRTDANEDREDDAIESPAKKLRVEHTNKHRVGEDQHHQIQAVECDTEAFDVYLELGGVARAMYADASKQMWKMRVQSSTPTNKMTVFQFGRADLATLLHTTIGNELQKVSRVHFEIYLRVVPESTESIQYWLLDKSANGTLVNNARVPPGPDGVRLHDNDRISVLRRASTGEELILFTFRVVRRSPVPSPLMAPTRSGHTAFGPSPMEVSPADIVPAAHDDGLRQRQPTAPDSSTGEPQTARSPATSAPAGDTSAEHDKHDTASQKPPTFSSPLRTITRARRGGQGMAWLLGALVKVVSTSLLFYGAYEWVEDHWHGT